MILASLSCKTKRYLPRDLPTPAIPLKKGPQEEAIEPPIALFAVAFSVLAPRAGLAKGKRTNPFPRRFC